MGEADGLRSICSGGSPTVRNTDAIKIVLVISDGLGAVGGGGNDTIIGAPGAKVRGVFRAEGEAGNDVLGVPRYVSSELETGSASCSAAPATTCRPAASPAISSREGPAPTGSTDAPATTTSRAAPAAIGCWAVRGRTRSRRATR